MNREYTQPLANEIIDGIQLLGQVIGPQFQALGLLRAFR